MLPTTTQQFRVLYRHFLFRMVDIELLSAQGDIANLLGQFAALLLFLGVGFSARLMFINIRTTPEALVIIGLGTEHSLIAATMLVVGLFAVLSWDTTFPDLRDVLALSPLPIRARTMFLARITASAASLGLTVMALNAMTGVCLPMAMLPIPNVFDVFLSPARWRLFLAFWAAMFASGAFIYGSVLSVQAMAALLLSRRQFLRVSSFLQLAAFCLFLSVYFLQPSLATPNALNAPENQHLLARLPSYWFLALLHDLNGFMQPSIAPLAKRAWMSLIFVLSVTGITYVLSYFRTIRRILEEPDIVPAKRGLHGLPRFGDSLSTALVHFSLRSLLRSRQHRVMLAFYLGLGFAVLTLFLATPRARQGIQTAANLPLLFSSLVMMCVWVVGSRVVFAVPLALKANWIFRMTEIRDARQYLAAIRRPLLVLAVAPAWLISAAVFLSIWPWQTAAGHLVVLGLWGLIVAWLSLYNFQKIPFTCSWLPGKSTFHMMFLAAVGVLFLVERIVIFEHFALTEPARYVGLIVFLSTAMLLARWLTAASTSETAIVQFEDVQPPAVLALGLHRDGIVPL